MAGVEHVDQEGVRWNTRAVLPNQYSGYNSIQDTAIFRDIEVFRDASQKVLCFVWSEHPTICLPPVLTSKVPSSIEIMIIIHLHVPRA